MAGIRSLTGARTLDANLGEGPFRSVGLMAEDAGKREGLDRLVGPALASGWRPFTGEGHWPRRRDVTQDEARWAA